MSNSGSVTAGGSTFSAHGNLFKSQEYVGNGEPNGSPSWQDVAADAYDQTDREVAHYQHIGSNWSQTSIAYDASSQAGLESSFTDANGVKTTFSYDPAGRQTDVVFAGDNGKTPSLHYDYDAIGHATQLTSSLYGTEARGYDYAGNLFFDREASQNLSAPATFFVSYYPDGLIGAVNVSSATFNQAAPNFEEFSYDNAGRLTDQVTRYGGIVQPDYHSYSPAGRLRSRSWGSFTYNYDMNTGSMTGYSSQIAYSNMKYNEQGNLVSVDRPAPNGTQPVTMLNAYNIRGNLTNTTYSTYQCNLGSNALPTSPQLHDANGFLESDSPPCNDSEERYNHWQFDPTQSVGTGYTITQPPSSGLTISVAYNFDQDLRQSSVSQATSGRATCASGSHPQLNNRGLESRSYDAQDHLVNNSFQNWLFAPTSNCLPRSLNFQYGWGPNGHLVSAQGSIPVDGTSSTLPAIPAASQSTLHWLGGRPMYESDSSGTVTKVFVGSDGSIVPSIGGAPQKTSISQRDPSQLLLNSAGVPVDFNFVQGAGYSPNATYHQSNFFFLRPDGISDPNNTFNGARSLDGNTGSWVSPDQGTADNANPITSKLFAFANLNTIENFDPSGFSSCNGAILEKDGNHDGIQTIACTVSRDKIPTIATTVTRGSSTPLFSAFPMLGTVYVSYGPDYLGRTQQEFSKRASQQFRGFGRIIEPIQGTENYTRYQDKCLEGFLICKYRSFQNRPGLRLNDQIDGTNQTTRKGLAELNQGADLYEQLGSPEIFSEPVIEVEPVILPEPIIVEPPIIIEPIILP